MQVAALEDVQAGSVRGDVLANTTSIGMQPNVEDSPLPAAVLSGFSLAFDAIYTPMQTQLLKVCARSIAEHMTCAACLVLVLPTESGSV